MWKHACLKRGGQQGEGQDDGLEEPAKMGIIPQHLQAVNLDLELGPHANSINKVCVGGGRWG